MLLYQARAAHAVSPSQHRLKLGARAATRQIVSFTRRITAVTNRRVDNGKPA